MQQDSVAVSLLTILPSYLPETQTIGGELVCSMNVNNISNKTKQHYTNSNIKEVKPPVILSPLLATTF